MVELLEGVGVVGQFAFEDNDGIAAMKDEVGLAVADAVDVAEFEPLATDGGWREIVSDLLFEEKAGGFRRSGAGGLAGVGRGALSPLKAGDDAERGHWDGRKEVVTSRNGLARREGGPTKPI